MPAVGRDRRQPGAAAGPGTASSTCRWRRVSRSRGRVRARGAPRRGARPRRRPARARRRRLVTSVAAPVRIRLVHALRRRAGHRPGDAHAAAGSGRSAQFAVLSAPLRTRRLDHHGAAGQRGDQPVAGQEPHPQSGRTPAAARTPPRPTVARWSSSSRGPPGRPGRRRRPAPRRCGRRTASAPRWAAWSMPNAAPETTVIAGPGERRRAISRGHVLAVGRRRARPHHGDRRRRARRGAAAPDPQPERRAALSLHGSARGRGRRAGVGHSSSPGTTNRMPLAGRLGELALGVEPPSRGSTSRSSVSPALFARGARRSSTGAPARATAAATRGSPGSVSRLSAARASRSSRHDAVRRSRSDRGEQRLA